MATRILVLGPPDIADPEPLLLGPCLSRLLGLLVASRDQPVRTGALVDRLWPDTTPKSGAAALRVQIARLRRALGHPESIVSTPGRGYRLLTTSGSGGRGNSELGFDLGLDLDEFESAVRSGDRLSGTEPFAAAEHYRAALELWRGPPFEGCDDDPATQAAQARVDARCRQARLSLCRCLVEPDHAPAVTEELMALAASAPGDEQVVLVVMRYLNDRGHRTEALRIYRRTESYLLAELDVRPSQRLGELADVIATGHTPNPTHGR